MADILELTEEQLNVFLTADANMRGFGTGGAEPILDEIATHIIADPRYPAYIEQAAAAQGLSGPAVTAVIEEAYARHEAAVATLDSIEFDGMQMAYYGSAQDFFGAIESGNFAILGESYTAPVEQTVLTGVELPQPVTAEVLTEVTAPLVPERVDTFPEVSTAADAVVTAEAPELSLDTGADTLPDVDTAPAALDTEIAGSLNTPAIDEMFTEIYGVSYTTLDIGEFGNNEFGYLLVAIEETASAEAAPAVAEINGAINTLLQENTADAIRFRREVGEDVEGFIDRYNQFLTENPDPSTLDIHGFVNSSENLAYSEEQIEIDTELAETVIATAEAAGVEISASELQTELAYQNDQTAWSNVDIDVPPGTILDDGSMFLGTIDLSEPEVDPAPDTTPDSIPAPEINEIALEDTITGELGTLFNGVASDDIGFVQDIVAEAEAMGIDVSEIDSVEAIMGAEAGEFVTTQTATVASVQYSEQMQAALADGMLTNVEYHGILNNYFNTISEGIVASGDVMATAEQTAELAQSLGELNTSIMVADPERILNLSPSELEAELDNMGPEQLTDFQSALLASPEFRDALQSRIDNGDFGYQSPNLIEAQQLMTAAGLYNRGIDGIDGAGTQGGMQRFAELQESSPVVVASAPTASPQLAI
ncbi:MAG: hypothetical protein AAF549_04655 [Pseudomonadota bacterium]